jgi:hypothetical protein
MPKKRPDFLANVFKREIRPLSLGGMTSMAGLIKDALRYGCIVPTYLCAKKAVQSHSVIRAFFYSALTGAFGKVAAGAVAQDIGRATNYLRQQGYISQNASSPLEIAALDFMADTLRIPKQTVSNLTSTITTSPRLETRLGNDYNAIVKHIKQKDLPDLSSDYLQPLYRN